MPLEVTTRTLPDALLQLPSDRRRSDKVVKVLLANGEHRIISRVLFHEKLFRKQHKELHPETQLEKYFTSARKINNY